MTKLYLEFFASYNVGLCKPDMNTAFIFKFYWTIYKYPNLLYVQAILFFCHILLHMVERGYRH